MEYRVEPENAGRKLRDILRQVMGVSYGAMKSAKWDGRITVNGVPTPVDAIMREGDVVAIRWKDAPVYAVKPYPLPLTIPYEDEHLFVIDKPAPLASQSSANHPDDALVNALFSHLCCPANYVYRPLNRPMHSTVCSGCCIRRNSAGRTWPWWRGTCPYRAARWTRPSARRTQPASAAL